MQGGLLDNVTSHHVPTVKPIELTEYVWHIDRRQVTEGRQNLAFDRLADLISHLEALRKVSAMFTSCGEAEDPIALIVTDAVSNAFAR
jgi:hypothetical protein